MSEEIRYIWHFDDGLQDRKYYTNKWIVVEKKYITPINAPSGEIMKLIVSGGVAEIEK